MIDDPDDVPPDEGELETSERREEGDDAEPAHLRPFINTDRHDKARSVRERQSQPGYRPPSGNSDTTKMRRAAEAITAKVTTTRLRQLGGIAASALGSIGVVFGIHLSALDTAREDAAAACAEHRRDDRALADERLDDEKDDTEAAVERLDRCEERLDDCRSE